MADEEELGWEHYVDGDHSLNNERCSCYGDEEDALTNVPTPSGLIRFSGNDGESSLSSALSGAVSCVVCKIAPFSAIFQCQHGHLICAGCYQVRVLDKMLGPNIATCPECSVRIYRQAPNRNLVVENALAKVGANCEFCDERMKRSCLRKHFITTCPMRLVFCMFRRLGCRWCGKKVDAQIHEKVCPWPKKTGAELLEAMSARQTTLKASRNLYTRFAGFIQLANITVRLLHVLPQATPMLANVFEPVARFKAFNVTWSILLMEDTSSIEDDNLSSIAFQLRLDSPIESTLVLSYSLMSGTYSEIYFRPNLCERFRFSNGNSIGPSTVIYRHCMEQAGKILNERGLYARLLLVRL